VELKKLQEQRADLQAEMQNVLDSAKTEERAMTDEESSKFDNLEKQIKAIDGTIEREERARSMENKKPVVTEVEERAASEEKAFASYIRGVVEQRADVNLTVGDNGAVIPSTIANKIIAKVVDICPVYQLADRYNVGGTLTIPLYDEATQAITCTYATEFTDLTSTSGKFTNISLTGFLAGVLTKISESLLNNNNFALTNFVIDKMAESISKWIEKELLNGTTDKIAGLSGVSQTVTAASATAVTADELIDVQEEVPDVYQENAIWIMSKKTRKAIRKLKNSDGDYLLNKDFTAKWGYTLLGKDVYTSANMPEMEAGKTAIYYGDMSGLAVKVAEDMKIKILRELFATQHAIGVVGYLEIDSKVDNVQKLAKFVMKSA
jgi:HK97 family phage major capsid protein